MKKGREVLPYESDGMDKTSSVLFQLFNVRLGIVYVQDIKPSRNLLEENNGNIMRAYKTWHIWLESQKIRVSEKNIYCLYLKVKEFRI